MQKKLASMVWRNFFSDKRGEGSVSFNPEIKVVNADDTVSIRQMNFDGGFYDMDPCNSFSDSGSIDLMCSDEDGLTFLDAVEHQVHDDGYFHHSG